MQSPGDSRLWIPTRARQGGFSGVLLNSGNASAATDVIYFVDADGNINRTTTSPGSWADGVSERVSLDKERWQASGQVFSLNYLDWQNAFYRSSGGTVELDDEGSWTISAISHLEEINSGRLSGGYTVEMVFRIPLGTRFFNTAFGQLVRDRSEYFFTNRFHYLYGFPDGGPSLGDPNAPSTPFSTPLYTKSCVDQEFLACLEAKANQPSPFPPGGGLPDYYDGYIFTCGACQQYEDVFASPGWPGGGGDPGEDDYFYPGGAGATTAGSVPYGEVGNLMDEGQWTFIVEQYNTERNTHRIWLNGHGIYTEWKRLGQESEPGIVYGPEFDGPPRTTELRMFYNIAWSQVRISPRMVYDHDALQIPLRRREFIDAR